MQLARLTAIGTGKRRYMTAPEVLDHVTSSSAQIRRSRGCLQYFEGDSAPDPASAESL